jgi:proteasome alpha subunit
MMTPFDWQEGVAHRAEFIENRLLQGAPILAVSIDAGVVIFTYHKHARKIFEIYDQLVLAGIGQQSDLESLRTASIDFAHQEGFNRSEKDVTLRRVVSSMSTPIKRAFADFQSPPFVVRCLFAEVSTSTEEDSFAILDYEGDFIIRKDYAYVAGSTEHEEKIKSGLIQIKKTANSPEVAYHALKEFWDATFSAEIFENYHPEAVLVPRENSERGIQMLSPNDPSI